MDLINKYKMLTYALVLGIIFAVSSAGAADFTNSSSGTINNKGTLRIKGDRKFRNAADYENIINEGTFEFTGNGKFTDAPEDINNDDENGSTALVKMLLGEFPVLLCGQVRLLRICNQGGMRI